MIRMTILIRDSFLTPFLTPLESQKVLWEEIAQMNHFSVRTNEFVRTKKRPRPNMHQIWTGNGKKRQVLYGVS